MSQVIERVCRYYQEFSIESLSELSAIYSTHAVFEDPIHEIQGLENITRYFKQTMTNVSYCRFKIEDVLEGDNQAFMTWQMTFLHPKLNKGREVILPGSSHLKFDEKIFYQRDYYDLGHMIYEQIPILGYIIEKLKNRMTS